MPYASKAQARFAHTDTAKSKGFPTVEFDHASKGRMAGKPERAAKRPARGRTMRGSR